MFFNRKADWRNLLKSCDYEVAAAALMHHLVGRSPTAELAAALERYFGSPGYEAALGVVAAEPDLILVFRESRPGGVYYRIVGGAVSENIG